MRKKVFLAIIFVVFLSSNMVAFPYQQEVGDGGIASIGHGNTNTVTTITGGQNQVEIKPKAGEGLVLTSPKEEAKIDEEEKKNEEVDPNNLTGETDSKKKEKKPRQKDFPWIWVILGSLFLATGIGWIVYFRWLKDDDEDEETRTDSSKPNDGGGGNIGTITITGVPDTGGTERAQRALTNTNPPLELPPSKTDVNYGGQGLTLKRGVIRVIQ